MTIFSSNEQVEFLATQCLHYDRYIDCQCYLERVNVDGKYGLVCGQESAEHDSPPKVLLEPVYNEITIYKISSPKAVYNKYAVFADGTKVGQFTLVLNAWVPIRAQNN